MKTLLVILSFAITPTWATETFVIEGHGQNWGYTSIDTAKENAFQKAQDYCQGEVELASDWYTKILRRNEGMFMALVRAEFRCL